MSNFTDEQINQARAFYANFLKDNNASPGEHTSILALAAYGAEIAIAEVSDATEGNQPSVEETEAFKEIKELHDGVLKQRDHNWNELQKANKEIQSLKAQLAKATATLVLSSSPEDINGPAKS